MLHTNEAVKIAEGHIQMLISPKGHNKHSGYKISFSWQGRRDLLQQSLPTLSDNDTAAAIEAVMMKIIRTMKQLPPKGVKPHVIVVQGWPTTEESLSEGSKCQEIISKYGLSLFTQ